MSKQNVEPMLARVRAATDDFSLTHALKVEHQRAVDEIEISLECYAENQLLPVLVKLTAAGFQIAQFHNGSFWSERESGKLKCLFGLALRNTPAPQMDVPGNELLASARVHVQDIDEEAFGSAGVTTRLVVLSTNHQQVAKWLAGVTCHVGEVGMTHRVEIARVRIDADKLILDFVFPPEISDLSQRGHASSSAVGGQSPFDLLQM